MTNANEIQIHPKEAKALLRLALLERQFPEAHPKFYFAWKDMVTILYATENYSAAVRSIRGWSK